MEELYNSGKLIQCPGGIQADEFIIEYFRRHPLKTMVISNDKFRDFPDVKVNRYNFVIMFDELILKPDLRDSIKKTINNISEVEINAHPIQMA